MSKERLAAVWFAIVIAFALGTVHCTPFRDGSDVRFSGGSESDPDVGASDAGEDIVDVIADLRPDSEVQPDVGQDVLDIDLECPDPPEQEDIPECGATPPTAAGCDFSQEDGSCRERSFRDLSLCGAELAADFRESNFVHVRLDEASADGDARFSEAVFNVVSMTGFVSRAETEFDSAEFVDVDFTGSSLEGDFSAGTFQRVLLHEVMLGHISLNNASFREATFSDTSFFRRDDTRGFRNVEWIDTCIVDCDFSGQVLLSNEFTNVLIEETDMSNMSTEGSDSMRFERVVLRGVDLRGTSMQESWFQDVVWDRVTCPDGTMSSDQSPESCAGHLEP